MRSNRRSEISVCFIEAGGRPHVVLVAEGTNFMQAAVDNGVAGIEGICGGSCSCGTCHMYVDSRWSHIVGPATGDELALLCTLDGKRPTSRLGCQLTVLPELDGMTIHIPVA